MVSLCHSHYCVALPQSHYVTPLTVQLYHFLHASLSHPSAVPVMFAVIPSLPLFVTVSLSDGLIESFSHCVALPLPHCCTTGVSVSTMSLSHLADTVRPVESLSLV
ncbi:unnamed protein product, partial [Ectocarpus sp. 12 AP-2014]